MSHTYLSLLYDLHIVAQLYDIVAHLSNIAANPFHKVILLSVIKVRLLKWTGVTGYHGV